jgi:hypothetical protein
MIQAAGEITELWLAGNGTVGGRMRCQPAIQPVSGQYLQAYAPELPGCFPITLFVSEQDKSDLLVAPPLPDGWLVGTRLVVRGPFGRGFRLPGEARRVSLGALEDAPYRLLPLIRQALAQQAMVTLYTHHIPQQLPVAVEVLPLESLHEAVEWADFLALDVRLESISTLPARLNLLPGQHCPCPTQVLVVASMPCGGAAECGVCGVRTRRGWALACKDGPVFDLNALEMG